MSWTAHDCDDLDFAEVVVEPLREATRRDPALGDGADGVGATEGVVGGAT